MLGTSFNGLVELTKKLYLFEKNWFQKTCRVEFNFFVQQEK